MRRGPPLRRFRSTWSGTSHELRTLAVMALVDATGSGLFLTASIAVFTQLVGVSGERIGLGLTAAGVISLAAAVPAGVLVDRFGPRVVLAGVSLWRAGGLIAYCWCHTFAQFLAVTCVLAVADRAAPPITQALVAAVAGPADRVRAMATLRSVRNVGFTVGGLLAGIALGLGSRPAYVGILAGDALSFVVVAWLVTTISSRATGRHQSASRPGPARRGGTGLVLRDRPFLRATLVNAVFSLHMTLLAVAIPIWVLEHTLVPRVVLAPMLVLNTVLTVALQVRASRGTDSVAGSARALYRAGAALTICCGLLAEVPMLPMPAAVAVLIVAIIVLTAGELWQSAGGWGLSYALAPTEHHGVYLSTFNTGVTAQQVFGPGVIAVLVIPFGSRGWFGLAAVLLVATGVAQLLLRGSARTQPVVPDSATEHRTTPRERDAHGLHRSAEGGT
jgi:MFS family permease